MTDRSKRARRRDRARKTHCAYTHNTIMRSRAIMSQLKNPALINTKCFCDSASGSTHEWDSQKINERKNKQRKNATCARIHACPCIRAFKTYITCAVKRRLGNGEIRSCYI